MQNVHIHDFFATWGICTFGPEIRKERSVVQTAYNLIGDLPIVGLVTAVFRAIIVLRHRHGCPNHNKRCEFARAPIATKIGWITHDFLGGLGGGLICFAIDAVISTIRATTFPKAYSLA